MSFNRGFMCKHCGPIETAKKKTINKVQYNVCAVCTSVVVEWTRVLTDRAGRCNLCGGGDFTLAIHKGHLLRCCKVCKEVVDTDQDCKIIREGAKEHAFK